MIVQDFNLSADGVAAPSLADEVATDGNHPHVLHLRGAPDILAYEPLLRDFAASAGQFTAMHGLRYRLDHEFARHKYPHLLCIIDGSATSPSITAKSLLGAALLFEYRFAGRNTGLFATGDSTGIGTVIAPEAFRAQVAALAGTAVLRQGSLALLSLRHHTDQFAEPANFGPTSALYATQTRPLRDRLLLGPSYEGTLDSLGRRTRNHLRYYRRRLVAATGCNFVEDAATQISPAQLATLNTGSLEPRPPHIVEAQFRATADLPGGYVHGLRAADGDWLSLAGGWRQKNTSLLEWQINSAQRRSLSPSTAFRAFLIEHEIARGITTLCFHGGTSHSISHAFQSEFVIDLLFRKPGPVTALAVRAMQAFAQANLPIAHRGNFLLDALRSPNLIWRSLNNAKSSSTTAR